MNFSKSQDASQAGPFSLLMKGSPKSQEQIKGNGCSFRFTSALWGGHPLLSLSLPQLLLAAFSAICLCTAVLSLLQGESLKSAAFVIITLSDKPSGAKWGGGGTYQLRGFELTGLPLP